MPRHTPIRKTHKKSRLGCQECKRRHVKCNEARPTCANCSNTSKVCVYRSPPPRITRSSSVPATRRRSSPAAATRIGSARSAATAPSPASVGPITSTPSQSGAPGNSPSITATPSAPSAQHAVLYPPLNMRHMELLIHFILETVPSIYEGVTPDREKLQVMMPAALSTPYIMYEALALSALHLSHTTVSPQAAYHREEATVLQTQALAAFNDSGAEVTAENCVPMLMFSSFLSLHTLEDAVTASKTDVPGFLDRFIVYLNLHRGVRVVTEQAWGLLVQSSLSSQLGRAEQILNTARSQQSQDSGQATIVSERLNSLLDNADMGSSSEQACRDAVSWLHLLYQSELLSGEMPGQEQTTDQSVIFSWPVMLSGIFTKLLMERRPEALVILCYYAVLLHKRRRMWLVRDAGRLLIEEMTRFLGTYWKEYLEWPNQMLEEPL